MSLHVSTPVGNSLVVDQVFKSYVMTVSDVDTSTNLIILDILDFDIILGMYWLYHYHMVMDYFSKTITLAMPCVPLIVG